MAAPSSEARARAEATFKKEERAREGAQAMMEYQANTRRIREKTARLRALRLANEAAARAAHVATSRQLDRPQDTRRPADRPKGS